VYRALDPAIGRTVAIKTILTDAKSSSGAALRERFRREARSAGNLSHPNIVTIHEFNDSGEIMFIAMEFIHGQTLAEKMAESGPLPLDLVLTVIRGAADALDYAHANHIVHRDVKPANFMLTASGQVKITDFGIAKILDDDIGLTNTGMVIGTAQYMSPEQIAAKPASARSDQFSLAVIGYEMLTGQKPFQGNSWASVMHQIMSVEPPPVKQHRQDLGDEVTTVLRKALAKDPDGRYHSCRDFAEELAHTVTGVTMERTAPIPIGEALKRSPPPPRPPALAETEVMASSTAIPWAAVSTPDTGQRTMAPGGITPGGTPAVRTAAPFARHRSALTPILLGAAAVVVLVVVWWRISARPVVEKPREPAPVAVATPVPAANPTQGTSTQASPTQVSPTQVNPTQPASRSDAPPRTIAKNQLTQPTAARNQTPAATPPPAKAAPVAAPSSAAVEVVTATPPPVSAAPAPVPVPPPTSTPKPAVVEAGPAPAPAAAVSIPAPTPAPVAARNAEAEEAARRAEEQRKAAEINSARKAVDDALNRYRAAFESKDSEALKNIWPGLGRSELSSFQNFFKIARTVKLRIEPLGEAEITAAGATLRARRTMAATDERGALPQQDQIVRINLRRSGNAMVIESIDTAAR
jgi:serine/threonine-protein kinase